MPGPFVSVLIDTYNHERFIEEAVNSVLAQDFPASDREILVVDDGSTDRAPEILQKFEPHIRILRKTNGGQASAFNDGIPKCRGQWIAFLDGDDWWAPQKLREIRCAIADHPPVGLIGHALPATAARISTKIMLSLVPNDPERHRASWPQRRAYRRRTAAIFPAH